MSLIILVGAVGSHQVLVQILASVQSVELILLKLKKEVMMIARHEDQRTLFGTKNGMSMVHLGKASHWWRTISTVHWGKASH
jgi:hypothetical protein